MTETKNKFFIGIDVAKAKLDILTFRVGYRLLRRYTPRNDCASNGEGVLRPWCQKILGTGPSMTGVRSANSFGRSMIEMLGVLAIVAVLSVGGIAGYSKAMEKFKVNKLLKEYTELIRGLIEYSDNIKKLPTTYETRITDYAINLGLVPNTWQRIDYNYIVDSEGNFIGIKHRVSDTALQGIVVDFLLGGLSQNEDNDFVLSSSFKSKLCVELFNMLVKPLHDVVTIGYVHMDNQNVEFYYGNQYCKNNYKCLKDMTFSDAERMCSKCDKKRRCGVVIAF